MIYKVSDDVSALRLNETRPVAAVLQNIAMLLATKKGEVPFFREFGLEQKFLDKPLNIAKPLLYLEVKEALERFVPQAELIGVEIKSDESRPATAGSSASHAGASRGRVKPIVEVNIKDEQ